MHPERGEDAVSEGKVTVNGAVCKKGDVQVKEGDAVAVEGRALRYQRFVYLMLNKPEGVVSASTDKRDITVVDLVGDATPGGSCSRRVGWTRPAPASCC